MKEAPNKVQDHAEAVASRLFEALFVGARMEKLQPDPPRTHDFDLLHSNGKSAVEVTVSLNEAVKHTEMRIRKGGLAKTELCKKTWWIQTAPGADIRKIRREADPHLADIESDGVERFFCPTDWHTPSVGRIFRALRVSSGSVISWKGPGIYIDLGPMGGRVDANAAVEAALREARKADNRTKLGATNANKRYLVVYVDPASNYLPWKALQDFAPPSEPLQLPVEVTDIWIFTETRTRSQHEYVVWQASASSPWRRIGPLVLPDSTAND
jgi:hypothetical protein